VIVCFVKKKAKNRAEIKKKKKKKKERKEKEEENKGNKLSQRNDALRPTED